MKSRSNLNPLRLGRVFLHIYLVLYVSSMWVVKANPVESKFDKTTQWVPTGNGNQKITGVTLGPEGRILAYVKQSKNRYDLKIKYLKDKGEGISILKNDAEIAAPILRPPPVMNTTGFAMRPLEQSHSINVVFGSNAIFGALLHLLE